MFLMNKLSIIVRYGHVFSERKLKEYEVGFPEHIILMYLSQNQFTNQDAISKFYMMDKGAIAKTVGKLEDKKLIVRKQNPENRRENIISISEKGAKMISLMSIFAEEWNARIYKDITEEDMAHLSRITDILTKNAVEAIQSLNEK